MKSTNDQNFLLRFALKNVKQFNTFFFCKNHPILSIETIHFDCPAFPNNTFITGSYDKKAFFYNLLVMDYGKLGNDNPDKIFKLFHRLNIDPTLNSLDSIFDDVANFFSQEDSLLKIYKGSYAEEFEPQATAWVKTDSQGKIDRGIIWKSDTNSPDNGKYEVYKSGKMITSGTESLEKFRKTFENFISTLGER